MNSGEIVLLPFPFSELTVKKVRPAIVVCETKDIYKDLVVCAVSSVIPTKIPTNEIMLVPNSTNKLRVKSVIKVDRIVTVKQNLVITKLGKLTQKEFEVFKKKFQKLID